MKRFHVHVHVDDLAKSIGFYSKLFAAEPSRIEGDYAKWMLEDPRINFAISTRGSKAGIDHLGFQTDDAEELAALKARAEAAAPEGASTACCTPASAATAPGASAPVAADAAACCTPAPRGKPIGIPVKSQSSCC